MAKASPKRRPVTDARTRKMRAVLAACCRLGLDEDARRELQAELTGTASMAQMSEVQLGQLLDHLNRDYKGAASASRPHLAKVKALWWSLYWLGAVDEPGDKALSAFVQRQTGISALRFLDHRSAPAVIEALKSWCEREGVAWPHPSVKNLPNAERWAVIAAIRAKLESAGLRHFYLEGTATRQLDELIRVLGKRWRVVKP